MGCTQCDFNGRCGYFEDDSPATRPNACDANGDCVADGDDDMGWCENYDSDWICSECGNDNNIEECECD